MAVLTASQPTLVDLANVPGAKDGELINLLAQFNPMLQDAPAMVCNKDTYHETYSDTSLPTSSRSSSVRGESSANSSS